MHLTVRDAAKLLNVSEKTIYRWVKEGGLPAYRVSEQYRFHRAELLEWATARRINVSPEIFAEPEGSGARLPGIVEALRAGGIFYRVSGTDRESVIRAIVDVMRLPDGADREFLYRVMLARENLASTGIGDGIAIPHVRSPIVLHVTQPTITLCFLEKPVDFAALDGRPVHVLFSLISPTVKAHLHLLSRLAFLLRDASLKETVLRQAAREEILAEAGRVEDSLKASAPVPAVLPGGETE